MQFAFLFMHIIMQRMPRIAKPPAPELPRLRRELAAYLEQIGSNPNSFSKTMGVNQSTVQRFLAGRTKNITETIRPLLVYAGIRIETCIPVRRRAEDPLGHQRIKKALEKVWDGSEASAEALAQVIEAVGPFLIDKGAYASRPSQ